MGIEHAVAMPTPAPQGRQAGFTLVEVLVASVILLMGIQGALAGVGITREVRTSAMQRGVAVTLADRVSNALTSTTSSDSCTGGSFSSDLLRDLQVMGPGRSAELLCFGPNCTPDYPRGGQIAADLAAVLGAQTTVGRLPIEIRVPGNVYPDVAMDHEVRVDGRSYRVVWNVICGQPFPSSQRVGVLVLWPPYTNAIAQGRFVLSELQKGSGF